MTLPFSLSHDEIEQKFGYLMEIVNDRFQSRSNNLMQLYQELELKVATSPASGTEHYHNSFPGGYLDHILRVYEYALKIYELWKSLGLDVSTFTEEELVFVALHHDLGKLGFPGDDNDRYVWNDSEWHRKNLGKIYELNPNIPFTSTPHLSLYLLQRYGVQITWNEMLGILTYSGLYDDANKPYYLSTQHKSQMRTSLPTIINQATLMAAQFEYERWASASNQKLQNYREDV